MKIITSVVVLVAVYCVQGALEKAQPEDIFGNLRINMLNEIHDTLVTSRQQKQTEFESMKAERVKQREDLEKEKARLQEQLNKDREQQFQKIKQYNSEQHEQFKGVLYQILRTVASTEEKKLGFHHLNLLHNISEALEASKQDSLRHFESIVKEDEDHHEKSKQKIKEDQVQLTKERSQQFQELKDTTSNQHKEIKTIFQSIMSMLDEPTDCYDILQRGIKKTGIYLIKPQGIENNFYVYCDMDTEGGGWTVIQRRKDYGTTPVSFNRKWTDYKDGFGDLSQEFWLGNDKISALTKQNGMALKVEGRDFNQNPTLAYFNTFKVDNEAANYRLTVSGSTEKSGHVFMNSNGQMFATSDRDSSPEKACALSHSGGWWFTKGCSKTSNLNGNRHKETHAAILFDGHIPLASVELKIRPADKKKKSEDFYL